MNFVCWFVFEAGSWHSQGWILICYVAKDDLEFLTLLPPPPSVGTAGFCTTIRLKLLRTQPRTFLHARKVFWMSYTQPWARDKWQQKPWLPHSCFLWPWRLLHITCPIPSYPGAASHTVSSTQPWGIGSNDCFPTWSPGTCGRSNLADLSWNNFKSEAAVCAFWPVLAQIAALKSSSWRKINASPILKLA